MHVVNFVITMVCVCPLLGLYIFTLDLRCNNDRVNADSVWWLCCNVTDKGVALVLTDALLPWDLRFMLCNY
jgi:hypothetical protein